MHVNFWILPIGILKLGFHTVEDISSTDLREREKVCLFSFFFHAPNLRMASLLGSTIYALVSFIQVFIFSIVNSFFTKAGELGLEIYSLSLASGLYVLLLCTFYALSLIFSVSTTLFYNEL